MRVHHVAYLVKSLKKSQKALETLGYVLDPLSAEGTVYDPLREVNILFMQMDTLRVELVEPAGKASKMYPLLKHYKNSLYHICYETENMSAEVSRMDHLSGYRASDCFIDECGCTAICICAVLTAGKAAWYEENKTDWKACNTGPVLRAVKYSLLGYCAFLYENHDA